MEYEEKSPTPLDNDALTRLIYLHAACPDSSTGGTCAGTGNEE